MFDTKPNEVQSSQVADGTAKMANDMANFDIAKDMRRLSLTGKLPVSNIDFNENTGTGLIKLAKFTYKKYFMFRESICGELNPWDERIRGEILNKYLPPTVDRHEFAVWVKI